MNADIAGVYHQLGQQDRAMVDLWRSVIAQAIRDMDMGVSRNRTQDVIRTELDAVQWLGSEDYLACCACALVDGVELMDRLQEVLQMKRPYRRVMLRDLADKIKEPPPSLVENEADYLGVLPSDGDEDLS